MIETGSLRLVGLCGIEASPVQSKEQALLRALDKFEDVVHHALLFMPEGTLLGIAAIVLALVLGYYMLQRSRREAGHARTQNLR